jgi:PAS domain S-box-containing protein
MDRDRSIFFENHPDPMWVYDLETLRFLDVNNAAIAKYGYARDDFLAMTITDIRPAEDAEALLANIRAAPDGLDEAGIWTHRLRSGALIDANITSHTIEFRGRRAKLVAARDVSRLMRIEREARVAAEASAQWFRTLFEAIPGKFLVMTPKPYRIVAVSDSYLRLIGVSRDMLIGRLLFDAFPDTSGGDPANGGDMLAASLQRVEATGTADVMPLVRYTVEIDAARPGVDRHWSVVNTPVVGADAKISYIIHRVEEMTDLVAAGPSGLVDSLASDETEDPALRFGREMMLRAEELQDSNRRLQEKSSNLRVAQRLLRLGSWTLNLASRDVSWSDSMYEVLGITRNEFGGSLSAYERLVHPDDRVRFLREVDDFAASGARIGEFRHRVLRPSGGIVHVRVLAELSDLPEGNTIFGVLQDVTPEVEAQQRLSQASSLARIAGRVAQLGGWRLDLDPLRVTWSDETAAIHDEPPGYSPGLDGGLDYYPPGDRDRIGAAVEACWTRGVPFDEVMQLVTAKGRHRWVRSIGEPEYGEEGRIVAVRGAFQDVTDVVAMRTKSDALAQRLAQTLESMNEAFMTLDRDWKFSFMNRQAEKTLNISRDALVGRGIWDGVPGGPMSALRPALEQAVRTRTSVRIPQYFSTALNLWFEINAHPTEDGMGLYFRDTTGEVGMTEQLRLLEKSVSHLNDMVVIIQSAGDRPGADHRIVYVNEAATRMTGLSREALIGGSPALLAGPEADPAADEAMNEAIRSREAQVSEVRKRARDGREYWVEMSINPVTDDSGAITHVVSVQRDITERKKAEQAVRLSEERFRLVSNTSSEIVWDLDLTTGSVWFNRNLAALFGRPHQEARVDLPAWRALIHPEDRKRVEDKLDEARKSTGLTWQDEFRLLRHDGSVAMVSDRGFFIRDEAGKALRMLGSFVDVTAEKEAAARKRQSQKLEAMGQLTGGVAHDFNNLLTIILGNAEMLMESTTDSRLRHMAETAMIAAERGAALTGRLLAFARKQPLQPRAIDITAHVGSMEGLLRRTLAEDISIEYAPSDGLWLVDVDASQLEVALLNLILNARDAMPGGGKLTLETANTHLDQTSAGTMPDLVPGDYVQLTVTDTGTGMAPEILERAFEPFFTTKTDGMGSGLGLSLVYGFVRQSGGQIKTYSEPGIGTCFKLYFPRSTSADKPGEGPQPQIESAGGREHILVVEDDDHVRSHLVGQLELLGYRVTSATTGVEAMEVLTALGQVDLLLTDVIMPGGMNGRQLADAACTLIPGLRVLYTSGYTENAIVHDGRLDPGVELLSKPYRRQELAAKVRKVLDQPMRA